MTETLNDYIWTTPAAGDDFQGYDCSDTRPRRTRKVTITEIIEEEDKSQDGDEAIDTDEIYKAVDVAIQDMKAKIECTVGEGLKKLRKTNKERRLFVKYLPGESRSSNVLIKDAKLNAMKEWRADYMKLVSNMQRKFDRIALDSMKDMEVFFENKLPAEHPESPYQGKTYIDFKTGGGDKAMKNLLKQLNDLCNVNQEFHGVKVPIYNRANANERNPAFGPKVMPNLDNIPFIKLHQMLNKKDVDPLVSEALENFKIRHYLTKKFGLKSSYKPSRRETNAESAKKRMLEARKAKKYKLVELKKNGQTRYLIVRSKRRDRDLVEPEDIFQDWRTNLKEHEIQAAQRKPRTRKLSHRAERKKIIEEAEVAKTRMRQVSYSEVLKKNLKLPKPEPPVDDCIEAWRDLLKDLEKPRKEAEMDAEDIFKVWRHNLKSERVYNKKKRQTLEPEENILWTSRLFGDLNCGQPTVKTIPKVDSSMRKGNVSKGVSKLVSKAAPGKWTKVRYGTKNKKKRGTSLKTVRPMVIDYSQEEYFGDWNFNLFVEEPPKVETKKPVLVIENDGYQAEKIFHDWLENFKEPRSFYATQKSSVQTKKPKSLSPEDGYMIEKRFQDWMHNLNVQVKQRPHRRSTRGKGKKSLKTF